MREKKRRRRWGVLGITCPACEGLSEMAGLVQGREKGMRRWAGPREITGKRKKKERSREGGLEVWVVLCSVLGRRKWQAQGGKERKEKKERGRLGRGRERGK